MTDAHPNVELIMQLDPGDLTAKAELFAEDVVFHYFNPKLPDLQGAHVGLDGIRDFFKRLGSLSSGTFEVHPVSVTPMGDELVVVHTQNSLTLDGQKIRIDVVVVWRIVEGRIAEAWDIPSAYTLAS